MLLSATTRQKLLNLLRQHFTSPSLDELLLTSINEKLADIAGNTGFTEQTLKVLGELEGKPASLRLVLESVPARFPNEPGVAAIVAGVLAELDEAAPTDDGLMLVPKIGGKFFANRASFRRLALEIVEDNGPRVTLLVGDAGVGKSHCWYFVNKLQKSKGIEPALLDLDDWSIDAPEIGAGELAQSLLRSLDLSADGVADDGTVQESRRAKQMVDTVVQRLVAASKAGVRPVVFIDHAYRAKLRKDAREFIVLLARKAEQNVVPGLRVIVVDPASGLAVVPSRDPHELLPINAVDLSELFSAELKDPAIEAHRLDQTAREVLEQVGKNLQLRIQGALTKLREGAA